METKKIFRLERERERERSFKFEWGEKGKWERVYIVGGKEGWDLGFHKIITRAGGDKDRRV